MDESQCRGDKERYKQNCLISPSFLKCWLFPWASFFKVFREILLLLIIGSCVVLCVVFCSSQPPQRLNKSFCKALIQTVFCCTDTFLFIHAEQKAIWGYYNYRYVGPCQKTTFQRHSLGDGQSGLSVDVYGPLLAEIANPVICSRSCCLARLISDQVADC